MPTPGLYVAAARSAAVLCLCTASLSCRAGSAELADAQRYILDYFPRHLRFTLNVHGEEGIADHSWSRVSIDDCRMRATHATSLQLRGRTVQMPDESFVIDLAELTPESFRVTAVQYLGRGHARRLQIRAAGREVSVFGATPEGLELLSDAMLHASALCRAEAAPRAAQDLAGAAEPPSASAGTLAPGNARVEAGSP